MSDYLTVANANSTFATKTQLGNYYTKTESDTSFLKVRKTNLTFQQTTNSDYTLTQTPMGKGTFFTVTKNFDTNTYNSLIIQPIAGNEPRLMLD